LAAAHACVHEHGLPCAAGGGVFLDSQLQRDKISFDAGVRERTIGAKTSHVLDLVLHAHGRITVCCAAPPRHNHENTLQIRSSIRETKKC
jgi:hypothetical protein